MRKWLYSVLVAGVIFSGIGVLTMGVFTVNAQAADLFVRNTDSEADSSSGSDGAASKKLYLPPGTTNTTTRAPRRSSQPTTLYNGDPNRTRQRRATPEVNAGSELDRIQEENIRRAQNRAIQNARAVDELKKQWDAERSAADAESEKRYQEKKQQERQAAANPEAKAEKGDVTYVRSEKSGNGMKNPPRTFNVFE